MPKAFSILIGNKIDLHESEIAMTLQKEPTILVIFGGMGDLTWRKLAPALYNLLLDQQLPEHFAVIGLDIKDGQRG